MTAIEKIIKKSNAGKSASIREVVEAYEELAGLQNQLSDALVKVSDLRAERDEAVALLAMSATLFDEICNDVHCGGIPSENMHQMIKEFLAKVSK